MLRFRRLLSALLAVIMCLTMMPLSGLAANPEGFDHFAKRNTFKSDIFGDVSEADWFYGDIKTVYELGLMLGKGDNTFDTESGVTIAEAITIAARIHSIYHTGSDAFEASDPWYEAYADYAYANGILTNTVNDYAKTATRAEFAFVLANALPAEALEEINFVNTDAIPDVKTSASYGEAVYKLYRAGIMIGNDDEGTFSPSSEIKRSEVAAIAARMADTSLRKSVSLGKEYTITFDMNGHGKQVPAQTVAEGGFAELPDNPEKAAYIFKGWYTQKTGGTQFNFDAPVYEDVTVYARWIMDPAWLSMLTGIITSDYYRTFTVTFESNGGTPVDSQTVKYGETVEIPVDPEKDGFTFEGWYVDAALTQVYDFSGAVNSDLVLYAKWRNIPGATQNVPEEIADLFGVDPDDYDTDGDGLSNYIEIYMTATDPVLVDTDEDGIFDNDEDFDEDDLTNETELSLGTDLAKKDTDNDGLSDFEEVNTYNTDPLNCDSDNDTLNDGDEILLGLNPLTPKTDGKTIDSERTFTQTLSENNISEDLLSEKNDAIPSLSLTASGNINNDVVIEPTSSNSFSDSRAIVGEAVDVIGENISEGIISFTLPNHGISLFALDDIDDTYSTSLICKYNEDGKTE